MNVIEEKIKKAFQVIPFGANGGNILDNNVVYSIEMDSGIAKVTLIIAEQYQTFKEETLKKVEAALLAIEEINEVKTQVVASQEELTTSCGHENGHHHHEDGGSCEHGHHHGGAAQKENPELLKQYKNIILVASGKGGVGKSTVAVNLALALKSLGKKVAIFDADVYGPSMPIMLGKRNDPAELFANRQELKPMKSFGLEFMSVGNLVKEEDALIWRGPMTQQVIQQIMKDTAWSGGDYIIVDLPPGTGDIQLSISQLTKVKGAVIVSTPQDVALLDAMKAIAMFEKVDIPVLGMIENMSSFICPKCGAETPIFAKGGAESKSAGKKIPFLGRIPIELEIRLSGDNGDPITHSMPSSKTAELFKEMATKLDMMVQD